MRGIRWLALIVALVGLVFVGRALEHDTALGDVPPEPVAEFDDFLFFLPMDVCFSSITVDLEPPDGPETLIEGPICFSGEAVIQLLEVFDQGGFATVTTQLVSMDLVATVNGVPGSLRAGVTQGLPPTPGVIQSQTALDCPCDSSFDVFFESNSANLGTLDNCAGAPVVMTAVILTFPDFSTPYTPVGGLSACDSGDVVRATGAGLEADPESLPPVGGTVELLAASGAPESAVGSSSGSGFNYAILGGALAAVAVAVAVVVAGGRYARKRWLW